MGNKSLAVDEFTTPNPKYVDPSDSLKVAWDLMAKEGIRHVLVKGQSAEILGILSHRDLTGFTKTEIFNDMKVEEVMSRELFTVSPEAPLYEVALKMSSDKIGSAVVIDPETGFVGIFTATDALNALVEVLRDNLD